MAAVAVSVRVCVRVDKMRVFVLLCVCLFVKTRVSGETAGEETQKSCDVLYREGVEAYLDERWQDCIDSFERAVSEYRTLKQDTVNCRIKCHAEADESSFMGPNEIDDLQFFEKMVRNTLCLLKCNKFNRKGGLNGLPKNAQTEFEQLRPYEYLQLCYYQKNLLQKAASAVFTFLVTNPDHEVMRENLKFYSDLPEVDMHQVVNSEARNFVSLYIHGSDAYQHEDYKSVINYIEESLEDYLQGIEECRAYCEGPFDQGWFPDFVPSIANHFTYCLKCKQKCADKINTLNGERHDDLLASHYHFLQYAYYKVGNLEKACECVASYLMFYPADETMLDNKKYYMKLPKIKKDFFTPRKEAVRYVQRQVYETRLLDFIDTQFVFQDGSENKTSSNETENKSSVTRMKDNIIRAAVSKLTLLPPPVIKFEWPKYGNNSKPNKDEHSTEHEQIIIRDNTEHSSSVRPEDDRQAQEELRRRKKRAVEQMQRNAVRNIRAVMGEKELRGKHRFVAEGFANDSECSKLMELAQVAAVQGDGYKGNKSPHTDFERFEGVTLGRAALLVYLGLIEVDVLDLYLNLSEMGRDYLERHFNLKTELYFTYTHLVCRTALNDSPGKRTDMSHAVHADNCNLLENGDCPKIPPAYTWRDFSAILYLNEDFEGGEFVFATDLTAKNIQSLVKPRCGRLVGFSAGSENLHGVHSVRRGRRCALGLWFTLNPFYEETEHILAKQVLHQVQQGGSITDQLLHELKKHISVAPSTSNAKQTSTVTTEQLKLHDKYVRESLSLHQESGEVLASGDSNKVQIERHKNENILDLYMPHDNYGYEDYQVV